MSKAQFAQQFVYPRLDMDVDAKVDIGTRIKEVLRLSTAGRAEQGRHKRRRLAYSIPDLESPHSAPASLGVENIDGKDEKDAVEPRRRMQRSHSEMTFEDSLHGLAATSPLFERPAPPLFEEKHEFKAPTAPPPSSRPRQCRRQGRPRRSANGGGMEVSEEECAREEAKVRAEPGFDPATMNF
jgi:hypothetical protein